MCPAVRDSSPAGAMPSRCASIESQTLPNVESIRFSQLSSYESLKDLDFSQLSLSDFPLPPSERDFALTSGASDNTSRHSSSSSQGATTLVITVLISFAKGSRLFKLRYRQVTIDKNSDGTLRQILLHDDAGLQSRLKHSFPYAALPIPHVEQPYHPEAPGPFVISFLGEQAVQTAQVVFSAQPHYSFERWSDCVAFQQTLLGEDLVFIAGVLTAKSRGRGEECVSQNLRVMRAPGGRKTLLLFANTQRGENKRYVSIPRHAIDEIDRHRRSKDRVTLKFTPECTDVLASMKSLTIGFFQASEKMAFLSVLD